MILYLTTRQSSNTLRFLYRDWAWGFRWRFRRAFYEDLLEQGFVPRATLLFSDHERMDHELLIRVRSLWDAAAPHCRVVNNPHHVLPRLPLLEKFYEHSINRHRGFRAGSEPQDIRYPVFLRREHDHKGALTDLLHDKAAHERARAEWCHVHDLLTVEFEDTSDEAGVYQKFSAFKVGDAIIPKHVLHADAWVTKVQKMGLGHQGETEPDYFRTNPHREQILRAFSVANIEYGRIDYGLRDGRIVVWEINTNPTVMSDWWRMPRWRRPLQREFARRYVQGLKALDTTLPGPPLRL